MAKLKLCKCVEVNELLKNHWVIEERNQGRNKIVPRIKQ